MMMVTMLTLKKLNSILKLHFYFNFFSLLYKTKVLYSQS